MSDPTNEVSAPLIEGSAVTVKTKEALGQAAPWVKFLGIVGSIGVGLLAVVGVGAVVFAFVYPSGFGEKLSKLIWVFVGLLYVVLAVVLFFPVRTTLRLAKATKLYFLEGTASKLESVAVYGRTLAKFYGVLTIVILAIYVVVLIALIFFVLFASLFSAK